MYSLNLKWIIKYARKPTTIIYDRVIVTKILLIALTTTLNTAPIIRPVPWPMNIINKLMDRNIENRMISNGCADMKYTINENSIQHTIEIGRSTNVNAV